MLTADPFAADSPASGYSVGADGTVAYSTVEPVSGSLLRSLQTLLGSEDVVVRPCSGTWVCVTAAEEDGPVNMPLTVTATTLGLRDEDGRFVNLSGPGVFLTVDRGSKELRSLTDSTANRLLAVFADTEERLRA